MLSNEQSPDKVNVKAYRKKVEGLTSILRAESGREFDPSPGNSMSLVDDNLYDVSGNNFLFQSQLKNAKTSIAKTPDDLNKMFETSKGEIEQEDKDESGKANANNLYSNDFKLDENEIGIRQKFLPYRESLYNLTNMFVRETDFIEIKSCFVTNDSSRIICVLQESDEHSIIAQYCTETFNQVFKKDLKGEYIKLREIC